MVNQALSILEQYELEIKNIRKGRSCFIVNCKTGDFVLKEYNGSEEKAVLQKFLTNQISEQTNVLIQEIVPNKEGALLTRDYEERAYTLQTYMEGRECNIKEERECKDAVQIMARMHKGMYVNTKEISGINSYSLQREFAKHNAELRRVRRYLKEKPQKNEFERFLYNNYNFFFERALEVESEWAKYEPHFQKDLVGQSFCHGDYQHHNVWMNYQEIMVLQFEKYMTDLPCRDLYLFVRKLLEKNNWNIELGKGLLEVYEKERPLPALERISMIYRFEYPEKFWKIVNYYFNSKKSFMPEKNMEKLEKLLEQQKNKDNFVNEVLKNLDK